MINDIVIVIKDNVVVFKVMCSSNKIPGKGNSVAYETRIRGDSIWHGWK